MKLAGLVCLLLAWFNAGLGREEAVPVETVAPSQGKPEVPPRQILFQFRVIELSRSKLDKLGFESTVLQRNKAVHPLDASPSSTDFQMLDDNAALLDFLEVGGKHGGDSDESVQTLLVVTGQILDMPLVGQAP